MKNLTPTWHALQLFFAFYDDHKFLDKRTLSTRIANTRIQQIMALKMQEEGKPKEWNKFYTLKSARKAVASHMEHLGCAPQTVALQMKHASIQSQMSYVCKFYKKKTRLVRELYKDL